VSTEIYPDLGIAGELTRVAQVLIKAADDPADVRVETRGGSTFFVVPDALADKVNLNPEKPKPTKSGAKGKAQADGK
jgi:hypothetical protein